MNQPFNSKEIQFVLDKVLKSRTFERSERARDLLNYLVTQEIEGKSEAIKGFSIAVDVFGKSEDFDPATDPLVRVHAGRLRELLSQYYRDEGKDDPIVISIPTGRYIPEYRANKLAVLAQFVDSNARPENVHVKASSKFENKDPPKPVSLVQSPIDDLNKSSFWRNIAIVVGVLAFGIVTLLLTGMPSRFWDSLTIDREDAVQDARASASQLPVLQVITDVRDKDLLGFADRLNSGLSAFDAITTLQIRPLGVLERRRGNWTKLEYGLKLIKTGELSDTNQPIILVELISLAASEVLRAEEYPADIWDEPGNERLVAQKLTNMAAPEGIIYADVLAKGETNSLMNCLGKVRTYYGLSNKKNHQMAYECAKALSGANGAPGLIVATYGGLIAEAAGKAFQYEDLPEDSEEAMRMALNTALKGIDLAPLSARAAREVGFVYSWQGAFGAMSDWFARANELNPNDTSVAASYGYGLVLSGEYKKAIPILKDAIGASTRHPSWWDFYFALALLMEERFEEASEAIIPMGLSKRSLLYSMLNAVLAYRKGNRHRAAFLVRLLREQYPTFAANPAGSFEKRHFPQGLMNNLVEALENSGLQRQP